MEEKVLLPYAKNKRGGEALTIAAMLRKDHGEIASLMVPSATASLCAQLKAVLARHNRLEEGPGACMRPAMLLRAARASRSWSA
jgi:hypothetical protein